MKNISWVWRFVWVTFVQDEPGITHAPVFGWKLAEGGVQLERLGISLTMWSFLSREAKPDFFTWLAGGQTPGIKLYQASCLSFADIPSADSSHSQALDQQKAPSKGLEAGCAASWLSNRLPQPARPGSYKLFLQKVSSFSSVSIFGFAGNTVFVTISPFCCYIETVCK